MYLSYFEALKDEFEKFDSEDKSTWNIIRLPRLGTIRINSKNETYKKYLNNGLKND